MDNTVSAPPSRCLSDEESCIYTFSDRSRNQLGTVRGHPTDPVGRTLQQRRPVSDVTPSDISAFTVSLKAVTATTATKCMCK